MPVLMPEPQNTLLGKETFYEDRYDPELLQAIPRSLGRKAIGDHNFRGTDIWRLYELSWLNPQGVPQAAWAELFVPATSPSIVESKSLKLYAGSYAMTPIGSAEEVARRFRQDVSACLGSFTLPADPRRRCARCPALCLTGCRFATTTRSTSLNPIPLFCSWSAASRATSAPRGTQTPSARSVR